MDVVRGFFSVTQSIGYFSSLRWNWKLSVVNPHNIEKRDFSFVLFNRGDILKTKEAAADEGN